MKEAIVIEVEEYTRLLEADRLLDALERLEEMNEQD